MNQNREDEIPLNWAKHGGRASKRRASATPAPPRIPRIARLMALAIKFQSMVDHGEVKHYADLARLGYVTRARITQIMNLLNLAPDIQERLLLADPADAALRPEQNLRHVGSAVLWEEQRIRWERLVKNSARL